MSGTLYTIGLFVCLLLFLVPLYLALARPWLLQWGATKKDAIETLSGDSVLPHPVSTATRAITIEVPPDRVWPWVVQIGQGRGGFYSYAWLENLFGCQIVNADRIHREWQDIKPGDTIRLHPKFPPIPVLVVTKNKALVLGSAQASKDIPPVTWAFVLRPATGSTTRLLVRWRSQTPHTLRDQLLNKYLLEPIHFVMERKMMLGIRKRATAAQLHT